MTTDDHILPKFVTAVVISLAMLGAAQSQDIKIGYAGALTGPASFAGLDIKRGAEMAVDEINANGGIKGQKLVLVARDDEHNPVRTVAQYRELVGTRQRGRHARSDEQRLDACSSANRQRHAKGTRDLSRYGRYRHHRK